MELNHKNFDAVVFEFENKFTVLKEALQSLYPIRKELIDLVNQIDDIKQNARVEIDRHIHDLGCISNLSYYLHKNPKETARVKEMAVKLVAALEAYEEACSYKVPQIPNPSLNGGI